MVQLAIVVSSHWICINKQSCGTIQQRDQKTFANYKRLTVQDGCKLMASIISYHSEDKHAVFDLKPKRENDTIKESQRCLATDFLYDATKKEYYYKNKHTISITHKY